MKGGVSVYREAILEEALKFIGETAVGEKYRGTFWIVEVVQGAVTAKRNFDSDLSGCG